MQNDPQQMMNKQLLQQNYH